MKVDILKPITEIKVLITGGTFDKDYDETKGELVFDKGSNVSGMLSKNHMNQCGLKVSLEELFLVDSLEMTDGQRELIFNACCRAYSNRVVITHGTDTIAKTAQFIRDRDMGQLEDKVIVLTGAMRPYALGDSDADFNLGGAMVSSQVLPPGIYICIHGSVFSIEEIEKIKEGFGNNWKSFFNGKILISEIE